MKTSLENYSPECLNYYMHIFVTRFFFSFQAFKNYFYSLNSFVSDIFCKTSANIPRTEWKVGERKKHQKKQRLKKGFSKCQKKITDMRTHAKKRKWCRWRPFTNSFPYHKCIDSSPHQLLSLSRKKEREKKKKRVKGPWDPQPHTQWLQQATWSKRRNTGHTLLMPALSGRQQGCGAGGCGWWRRCELVHLFLHPPQQLSVELTWEMGFHQGQGEGRSGEVFERHPLQGFGKLLHKTAPAQWGATV